ncbi:hypothetical protein NP568_25320, partial [Vibrio parahaemolyticus]|nr:hypothetical protein [Vibrio parahaemolyticus]
ERNLYVETLEALNLDMMSFITLDGHSLVSLSRENTQESSSSLKNKVVSEPHLQQHILPMNSKLDVHTESMSRIFKIND